MESALAKLELGKARTRQSMREISQKSVIYKASLWLFVQAVFCKDGAINSVWGKDGGQFAY